MEISGILESLLGPQLWGILALWSFGLLGSLHCSVMCGSICAFAREHSFSCAKKKQSSGWGFFLGRTLAYTLAGFAFGLIGSVLGQTLANSKWGLWAGAIASTLLVSLGLFFLVFGVFGQRIKNFRTPLFLSVKQKQSTDLKKPRPTENGKLIALMQQFLQFAFPGQMALGIGLFTVLIPCGFLWAALAQSAALAHPVSAAIGMAGFALATTPALAVSQKALTKFGSIFGTRWKTTITGVALCCSAFLIFSRTVKPSFASSWGLGNGVPANSPAGDKASAPPCH